MSTRYDDIIHLSRPRYPDRSTMSRLDRAAQFAPFAALTGHGAAIAETGRYTNRRIELDENRKSELNRQLSLLRQMQNMQPAVSVTYFRADERKSGGAYITAEGRLLSVKPEREALILTDGVAIPFADIYSIESPVFLSIPDGEETDGYL